MAGGLHAEYDSHAEEDDGHRDDVVLRDMHQMREVGEAYDEDEKADCIESERHGDDLLRGTRNQLLVVRCIFEEVVRACGTDLFILPVKYGYRSARVGDIQPWSCIQCWSSRGHISSSASPRRFWPMPVPCAPSSKMCSSTGTPS